MHIIGLDPGPTHTGYAIVREDYKVMEADKVPNDSIGILILMSDVASIEGMTSYGNKIGNSFIKTCYWIGRFWEKAERNGVPLHFYTRPQWGKAIVGHKACNDEAVKIALGMRFGGYEKGQPLELLTNTDKRSAFGVAVYHLDLIRGK